MPIDAAKSFTKLFNSTPPQAGDVVRVFGGYGGNYHCYSDDPSLLTNAEVFPIVIPAGVVVKRGDGTPVFVAPGASSTYVGPVFRFEGGGGATLTSKLEGIHLLGADTGVVIANTAGGSLYFEATDCVFARNRTGLFAGASDGQSLDLLIEGCSITDFADGSVTLIPAPRLLQHEIGVAFEAVGNGGAAPPIIEADLNGLTTSGSFESAVMHPISPRGSQPFGMNDYPNPGDGGQFTRILQVYVQGDEDLREYPTPANSSATVPTPEISVQVNGGIWDGQALLESDRGWDVGVYAVAEQAMSSFGTNNYLSRFRVDLTGTIIEEMKLVGAYVECNEDTRGLIALGDQTTIRRTGQQVATSPDGFRHSGVYGLARRGFLRILGNRAVIQDNVGCGIYTLALESGRGPLPFGGLLGLDHCEIHDNKEHGIHLLAAKNTTTLSRGITGAVVGGTWDLALSPNAFSFVPDSAKPSDPNIAVQGQGYLDGCAISGGGFGKNGVRIEVDGDGRFESGFPSMDYSAASLRIVNSYVWGFTQDAYHANITMPNVGVQGPALLTPVVHSTFADNAGYSFNIVHQNPLAAGYTFYLAEPGISGKYLNTSLTNCIFQRTNDADLDLGPFLDTGSAATNRWKHDRGVGDMFRDRNFVFLAGLRGTFNTNYTPDDDGDDWWLPLNTPFQGTPGGLAPDQWFLVNAGADPLFLGSNNYLNAGSQLSEDVVDIENFPRPSYPTRDKGGEED